MVSYRKQKENVFDFDYFAGVFDELLMEFSHCENVKKQDLLLKELNSARFDFETEKNLVTLWLVQDFKNDIAEKDYQAFMANEPAYQKLVQRYYTALMHTPFREELEQIWGKQLFRLAEVKTGFLNTDIQEELNLENQLMAEYGKLLGTAETEFQGKKVSLTCLHSYMASGNRGIRKMAYEARSKYFNENEPAFDEILDRLIKIRTKMARKLGRDNFISVGYERMNRTDITPQDMSTYRKQIQVHGVPFVSGLREKQRNRLGVSRLKYYDDKVLFEGGSPKLNMDIKEITEKMKELFSEMSEDTKSFYQELMENENYDLFPRQGKRGGGYATYLGSDKKPFIFANFTGISNDFRVFTHEAGHAFQFYMSRSLGVPEYIIPVDSAEVFSFAMERFSWQWIESFFGDDAADYKYSLFTEAFLYMPHASAIDEFEHYLYECPDDDIKDRKQKWRELEAVYLPELDYDGNEYLEGGGSFHGIAHIFLSPFYFIDYDLAHNSALQLWQKSQSDFPAAWKSYLDMCKAGGSRSFKEHLQAAGLTSPFEADALIPFFDSAQKWVKNHL
ncbi:M3 family oligoendopeptidase [Bacillus sp. AK031]